MSGIRLASVDDFDVYYKIKCGYPDIYWNGFAAPPDKEGIKQAFLGRLSNTPSIIGSKAIFMIEADDGNSCGYIMFTYNKDDTELGFSILEEYQSQGYGTMAVKEALKLLKGQNVFARVRPDNMPSKRCFEKNGFHLAYQEEEERLYLMDGSKHRYNRFEIGV